jgi:hypothetical protein
VCGSGTTGCHGHMEAERVEAALCGWEVSKFTPDGKPADTTARPVWMPFGPMGEGWYLLDDAYGIGLLDPQPDPPHLF